MCVYIRAAINRKVNHQYGAEFTFFGMPHGTENQ
jgi:hypothetical protein